MSEVELKSCPFCGGTAELIDAYDAADDYDGYGGPWNRVQCVQCKIGTRRYGARGKGKPSAEWNARSSPWIRIEGEDDLPKEFPALFKLRGGEVVEVWRCAFPFTGLNGMVEYYSHWMPLPPAPTTAQEGE